jgi:hypothetical protein
LQQQAAEIEDENGRRQFLENISFNREIVAAWEQLVKSSVVKF